MRFTTCPLPSSLPTSRTKLMYSPLSAFTLPSPCLHYKSRAFRPQATFPIHGPASALISPQKKLLLKSPIPFLWSNPQWLIFSIFLKHLTLFTHPSFSGSIPSSILCVSPISLPAFSQSPLGLLSFLVL